MYITYQLVHNIKVTKGVQMSQQVWHSSHALMAMTKRKAKLVHCLMFEFKTLRDLLNKLLYFFVIFFLYNKLLIENFIVLFKLCIGLCRIAFAC